MAFLSGADGGTRTRDLFLTKEVLYLLSYISVSMILTVCGDLRLPAFLPPAGFTKEVLYLLSYISVSMILTVRGDLRLPAFLPPDGFTKEVLYLLSYISIGVPTVVFIRLCRTPRAGRTSTVSAIVLSKATTLLIILSRVCFVNRNAIVATRKNERRAEPPSRYSSLSSESGLPGCCSTG